MRQAPVPATVWMDAIWFSISSAWALCVGETHSAVFESLAVVSKHQPGRVFSIRLNARHGPVLPVRSAGMSHHDRKDRTNEHHSPAAVPPASSSPNQSISINTLLLAITEKTNLPHNRKLVRLPLLIPQNSNAQVDFGRIRILVAFPFENVYRIRRAHGHFAESGVGRHGSKPRQFGGHGWSEYRSC